MSSANEGLSTQPTTYFIVGCGDIGLRVAIRLRQRGDRVTALVRSQKRADQLRESGACEIVSLHDLDQYPPSIPDQRIFWFAPPPAQGASDPRLRNWMRTLDQQARRIVYISTSGVYGNCGQDWIDETTPINPVSQRAHRRADAEDALRELSPADTEYVVLRVPGIYGPGRLPVARLRKALPVVDDQDLSAPPRWSNRIHADDLADIAVAAMDRGQNRGIYNAADGNPSTMCDYFSRCATLLGLPAPPRISLDQARQSLSPAMLSFLNESRRISNQRVLNELKVTLRYPSLDQGLPACIS